jgi:radical SAM protein with 4Fe4S-binding SPASM domain
MFRETSASSNRIYKRAKPHALVVQQATKIELAVNLQTVCHPCPRVRRLAVQPCAYWQGGGAPLDPLLKLGREIVTAPAFEAARSTPPACRGCTFLPACRGGCAGRRRLLDALDAPDPYCPVVRGEDRRLSVSMAAARELPKTKSACTTVVISR